MARYRPAAPVITPLAIDAGDTVISRGAVVGVSLTTYVRSVLEAHSAGRTALEYREAKPGMGSASTRTRKRVSRAGVKGRKNKGTDRG